MIVSLRGGDGLSEEVLEVAIMVAIHKVNAMTRWCKWGRLEEGAVEATEESLHRRNKVLVQERKLCVRDVNIDCRLYVTITWESIHKLPETVSRGKGGWAGLRKLEHAKYLHCATADLPGIRSEPGADQDLWQQRYAVPQRATVWSCRTQTC